MNALSALLILSGLLQLASSRLGLSIRMMAFQGIVLALVPLLSVGGHGGFGVGLLASGTLLLKGIALPLLLDHVLHRVSIDREIEPFVSYPLSILIGTALLGLSFWVTAGLLRVGSPFPLLQATAFFLVLVGLFLIVSRRKAITQVLGYLVLENGIYAVSLALGRSLNAFVELGVLLDVFVGVFLMGILIFHINREFDHIDADLFNELSDLPRGRETQS